MRISLCKVIKECLDKEYNQCFVVSDTQEKLDKIKLKLIKLIEKYNKSSKAKLEIEINGNEIYFSNGSKIVLIKPEEHLKETRGKRAKFNFEMIEMNLTDSKAIDEVLDKYIRCK